MFNNIMMVGAALLGLVIGVMFSYGIALLTLEFLRLTT